MEKVKVVRTNEREGLIRARVIGALHATGDVLTYLDSHCEVNRDWVQPLLARISEGEEHVVTPIIDLIDDDTFRVRLPVPWCWRWYTWLVFLPVSSPSADHRCTLLSSSMDHHLW